MSAAARRRTRGLRAIAAGVSLLGLVLSGCGAGSTFERDDDIDAAVDDLAAALGADEVHADAYHRRSEPGCAANLDLPEEEAWFERNTFGIPAQPDGAARLPRESAAHLRAKGFEVDELVAPLSGSRGLRAIRDELTIGISFVGDGANLTVTAGPCAVDLTPIGERYEVIDSGE